MNLLLDLDYPIHFVLTESSVNATSQIIGVAQVEWRKVLHSGRISTLIELTDPLHPQMSVGALDIILEFLPLDGEKARRDELEFHMKRQEKKKMEIDASFYLFAKQWWNDYLQIRAAHSTRLVKIFANNEFGKRNVVTKFIAPLACRWLETPRHAARFVSLIEYLPAKRVGDSR